MTMSTADARNPKPESRANADWQSSWRKRAEIAAIAGIGYPLINALGHTLKLARRRVAAP